MNSVFDAALTGMAEAVEGACVVCIVMSREYKESDACRTEADYAYTLKKHIVPIMAVPNYRPDGWLGVSDNTYPGRRTTLALHSQSCTLICR